MLKLTLPKPGILWDKDQKFPVWVNMDKIIYMTAGEDGSMLFYNSNNWISVRETPDEIERMLK